MPEIEVLPVDAERALLLGRAQLPEPNGGPDGGPAVIVVAGGEAVDITRDYPVTVTLLDEPDPAGAARRAARQGRSLGPVADLIANSWATGRDPTKPYLLAPIDLQAIKAAGVTFADSLAERVIEERTKGDLKGAEAVRQHLAADLGVDLASIRPGSPEAARLREVLAARGLWSPYLEVGLGPDAEIFTKAQPMSAVGQGAQIGIHPASVWNNPEPEVVLAVNAAGHTVGAMLGNDVNLRDFEGRSALLLGRSKDNNASCALGPFLRLFDADFDIEDVRRAEVQLLIEGGDNFRLEAVSNMARISRDPLDLVAQTIGKVHQYPDGFVLFLGTMFAPTQDRDRAGEGFTHKPGDLVMISSSRLGSLVNTVGYCDQLPPWEFGVLALMRNLAKRGVKV